MREITTCQNISVAYKRHSRNQRRLPNPVIPIVLDWPILRGAHKRWIRLWSLHGAVTFASLPWIIRSRGRMASCCGDVAFNHAMAHAPICLQARWRCRVVQWKLRACWKLATKMRERQSVRQGRKIGKDRRSKDPQSHRWKIKNQKAAAGHDVDATAA